MTSFWESVKKKFNENTRLILWVGSIFIAANQSIHCINVHGPNFYRKVFRLSYLRVAKRYFRRHANMLMQGFAGGFCVHALLSYSPQYRHFLTDILHVPTKDSYSGNDKRLSVQAWINLLSAVVLPELSFPIACFNMGWGLGTMLIGS